MKIFPRTHTRPWLCANGRILRSHQMNANFFFYFFLFSPFFCSPVQLLKWVHIHTSNSNGYVRLVVNWSFAIAYIVMNIRWENVFHRFSFAERTIYISIAVVRRRNKPLTMESNTKSIYTVHTQQHSHWHRRLQFNFCPSALSVCLFVELAQQSQSHEIINLKSGLDFRFGTEDIIKHMYEQAHTHSHSVCRLKSVRTDSVQF